MFKRCLLPCTLVWFIWQSVMVSLWLWYMALNGEVRLFDKCAWWVWFEFVWTIGWILVAGYLLVKEFGNRR